MSVDTDRFRYCTIPVEDSEFEQLDMAYETVPAEAREAVAAAREAEERFRELRSVAERAMNDWARNVIGDPARQPYSPYARHQRRSSLVPPAACAPGATQSGCR